MKKKLIYKVMKDGSIRTEKGEVHTVDTPKGPVLVGLTYKRPYWSATHWASGLSVTPYSDAGGYEKKWENKEELLEALTKIDFHSRIPYIKKYIAMVNHARKQEVAPDEQKHF